MYCSKCGKEIDDDAVVCIGCGCATKNDRLFKESSKTTLYSPNIEEKIAKCKNLGIASIIGAVFIPLIGWILAGIGLSSVNSISVDESIHIQLIENAKKLNIIGLIVATCMFVLNLAFIIPYF